MGGKGGASSAGVSCIGFTEKNHITLSFTDIQISYDKIDY